MARNNGRVWEIVGYYRASRRYYGEGVLRAAFGALVRGWRDV